MNKKYHYLVSFFLIIVLKSFSQTLPQFRSPEVAALNNYIDFPINKSTGIPHISIPLYTIALPDYSLPISLSYHAGGIKVDEQAGNIGLGWALNAGGVISRVIRDMADESGQGYFSNFGSRVTEWHTCYVAGSIVSAEVTNDEWLANTFDKEPDVYYFNFGSYSGKFVFDQNRKIHIFPNQDIKIETTNALSWKITTPDGSQYSFGTKEYVNNVYDPPTAWHLDKITTPNLHVINFEYEEYGYDDETLRRKTSIEEEFTNYNAGIYGSKVLTKYYSRRLTKIRSALCDVVFTYKSTVREDVRPTSTYTVNDNRALDNLQIINKSTNTLFKKFNFSTSYFSSSLSAPYSQYGWSVDTYLSKRLRLDAITECDGSQNCLPSYVFTYNKNNTATDLPLRVSTGRDHWGYYNGVNTNQKFISNPLWMTYSPLAPFQTSLANREPNDNYRKAFILDEIKFPTGGVTSYYYESIWDEGVNSYVGGLRVKKIINSPGLGKAEVSKFYSYIGPALTGYYPMYSQETYSIECLLGRGDNNQGRPCENDKLFSDDPINSGGNDISSNYIIHSQVIERQQGLGSTEYFFDAGSLTNEANFIDITISPYILGNPFLLTGKLLLEQTKSENGSLLRETHYTYENYNYIAVGSDQEWRTFFRFCEPYLYPYTQITGAAYLKEKKDIVYDDLNSVSSEQKIIYEYGGIPSLTDISNGVPIRHHFVTKETSIGSDGVLTSKRYKYPMDYVADIGTVNGGDTWDEASKGIKTLIDQYKIAQPVEEIVTRTPSSEMVMGGKLASFKASLNWQNFALPTLKNILLLNSHSPISYTGNFFSKIIKTGSAYQFERNNNYELETEFLKYDGFTNILDVSGKEGLNSFVWAHNGFYPVSKVLNADSKDVFFTSFEDYSGSDIALEGKTGEKSKLNGFQKSLSGLTNGAYNLHYWRKDAGVWSLQASTVAVSSGTYTVNLSGQVDEVRFYPASSQINTYTYAPLLGITSSNDANNKISSFQYDGHGNLLRVRDMDDNILQQYDYQYQSIQNAGTNWQETGLTRCKPCIENPSYTTSVKQKQYKDLNTLSPTYNRLTWSDVGTDASCGQESGWQNTAASPACETIGGYNTGYQKQQQINMNPCHESYLKTRWVTSTYNTASCPKPIPYAKIYYGNIEYNGSDCLAEIQLQFYADPACTIPMSVDNSITVNIRIENSCTGTSTTSVINTGGVNVFGYNNYNYLTYVQNGQTCTVDYYVNPGSGYIVAN